MVQSRISTTRRRPLRRNRKLKATAVSETKHERLSPEWFEQVAAIAAKAPEIETPDFVFDLEILEVPGGKVRAHGTIKNGVLTELDMGKIAKTDDPNLVEISLKAKRVDAFIDGEIGLLTGFMRGEIKIDGAYELLVDHYASNADADTIEEIRAQIAQL